MALATLSFNETAGGPAGESSLLQSLLMAQICC